MTIIKKLKKPKATSVFNTYWKFAAERQAIFFRKIDNQNKNLTKDFILKKHRFTNAYRASDRVSQYLIKKVIYKGNKNLKEVFFRILLFKTFNKIETWTHLNNELGEISFKEYSFKKYCQLLNGARKNNGSMYSGAYIMASGKSFFGYDKKHQNHLKLLELMMKDNLPEKISRQKSMQNMFELFKNYPTIGNFLAYQYTIDINYSELTSFSEMDFVEPGPGAMDGIKKCFYDLGDYTESDVIRYVTDIQEKEFDRLELNFQDLWGRKLHLIDCQNLFCEVDKYARVAHPKAVGYSNRRRIKRLYEPNHSIINYWYPPKWKINQLIKLNNKNHE
jgi:hypothetical protein